MKSLIVGILMLIIPVGYIFYLLASKMGVLKTAGVFVVTIVWTSFASDLLYKGMLWIKRDKSLTNPNQKD